MTVLQTLPALDSGGVERGTLEIARALVAAGHRSIVVSRGGRLVEALEREGSEHITLPVHRKSLRSLLQVRPFRRLLADLRPDIVHARSRVPAWISWLALRGMDPAKRPRFVTTVHGLYSVSPYSEIMTRGERVVAVSDTVRGYILRNYPRCPADRITVIHRGVDPAEFPRGHRPPAEWIARWQRDFPQLAGRHVIALPGRITRLKGHETLIDLVATLKADGIAVHALVVGGAEEAKLRYLAELKAAIAARGLQDDITFTGQRGDIRDVLSQCDVVLSLSTKPESFGRTVLEALSLGRPVVGWDVGGAGEILRALFPEGAVPPGDTTALHARVARLLDHPGVPVPNDRFLLNEMTARTLALYHSLLSSPG